MSTIRKRLEDAEARRAFHDYCEAQRQFKGRTRGELKFFSIHGYFPTMPCAARIGIRNHKVLCCGSLTRANP